MSTPRLAQIQARLRAPLRKGQQPAAIEVVSADAHWLLARVEALAEAARAVTAYDWSDSDEDAAATITALRHAVADLHGQCRECGAALAALNEGEDTPC